jgi:hypothetical protein
MPLLIDIKANIRDVTDKLGKLKQNLQDTVKGSQAGSLSGLITASMAGIAATAAYKIAQSMGSMLEAFKQLRIEAAALGVTTVEMAGLADVANYAGVNLQSLSSTLSKLTMIENQAALGSADATMKLAAMGLSLESLSKMDAKQKLMAIKDGIMGINDAAERYAVSMAIFSQTPEQLALVGDAFSGLQLDNTNASIERASKSWTTLYSAIKQVGKVLISLHPIMKALELPQMIKKDLGIGNKAKQGTAEEFWASGDQQAAAGSVARKIGAGGSISATPVDQMRRIGAFMPGGSGSLAPMQEQVQVSKEIRDHVMKVYEAMKSVDDKTPGLGAKF